MLEPWPRPFRTERPRAPALDIVAWVLDGIGLDDVVVDEGLVGLLRLRAAQHSALPLALQQLLFVAGEVVVAAEPERELEAHALERTGGTEPPLRLWAHPVGHVETPGVPALAGRLVVEILHPARLEAEDVAGKLAVAELACLLEQVERVDPLVADEGEAEGEGGQQRGAAGERGVDLEELAEVAAGEDVEVDRPLLGRADHRVLVGLADVDDDRPGGVEEEAASLRGDRHRNGDVARDVPHVDLVAAGAALEVGAARVAETVDARSFVHFQCEAVLGHGERLG